MVLQDGLNIDYSAFKRGDHSAPGIIGSKNIGSVRPLYGY